METRWLVQGACLAVIAVASAAEVLADTHDHKLRPGQSVTLPVSPNQSNTFELDLPDGADWLLSSLPTKAT